MKGKCAFLICLILFVFIPHTLQAAVNKTVYGDAPTRQYVFVENDTDDNFFVTPGGELNPRLTGSNRWTGLQYTGTGSIYQESLGYIDNGYNILLKDNSKFDMWMESGPVTYPMRGLRCINWYPGCDIATSLIPPATTDEQGFYGVSTGVGGNKWMHGMLTDAFYQYMNTLPVGGNFTVILNGCQTKENYNAQSGQRCKDMNSGEWYVRKVSFTKGAHMKFFNTNALSEVFIDSNGKPTLGEGNQGCVIQFIGTESGLSCGMMSYTLNHNGLSNTSIHVFPALNHAGLAAAIKSSDMQFSLDGKSWKKMSGVSTYYTFNDMKGGYTIFLFLSNNFFKKMVDLGISDSNTRELFNFRLNNTTTPESGWYEFSTSRQLIIKPRDFSVSIVSTDYTPNPHRSGEVGREEPPLDFDYIVTTSGKTAADEVLINVTGPTQTISGRPWCIFSSPDGLTRVPFPGLLIFTTQNSVNKTHDVGCDGQWRDMTDALWVSTPWSDSNGNTGLMNKSTVRFSIPMDSPESLKTINNASWYGEVSASGEINVKATWRNVR